MSVDKINELLDIIDNAAEAIFKVIKDSDGVVPEHIKEILESIAEATGEIEQWRPRGAEILEESIKAAVVNMTLHPLGKPIDVRANEHGNIIAVSKDGSDVFEIKIEVESL